jgi:glutamate carboxypeptidase
MRSSAALLRELAPRYHAALVLECGRENGDIVSARKGAGQFVIEVAGRSAHAGVEPHRGASAVLALAQITVALHQLNGRPPGATLNVGVVQGGTARNVVPDAARAEVDVRVALPEDMEVMEAAIRSVAHASPVPGTRAEVSGGWTTSPMARTPAVSRLVEVAVEAGQDLGIEIGDAATGGVSYANLLASLSVPVLDGLGPVGGLDHSPREYIEVSSIVPRTALLALLLERYARGLQTTRDRLRQT